MEFSLPLLGLLFPVLFFLYLFFPGLATPKALPANENIASVSKPTNRLPCTFIVWSGSCLQKRCMCSETCSTKAEFTAAFNNWASHISPISFPGRDGTQTGPGVKTDITWSWSLGVAQLWMCHSQVSLLRLLPLGGLHDGLCSAAQIAPAISKSVYKAITVIKWPPEAKADLPHPFWRVKTMLFFIFAWCVVCTIYCNLWRHHRLCLEWFSRCHYTVSTDGDVQSE